jgi:hypothetical protein
MKQRNISFSHPQNKTFPTGIKRRRMGKSGHLTKMKQVKSEESDASTSPALSA